MPEENKFKYLRAPTIEQIDAAVKSAGVTDAQFERFHKIYPTCIYQVRCGFREMPAKHWHIFFETEPTSGHISKISSDSRPETAEKRTIEHDAADAGRMTEFG